MGRSGTKRDGAEADCRSPEEANGEKWGPKAALFLIVLQLSAFAQGHGSPYLGPGILLTAYGDSITAGAGATSCSKIDPTPMKTCYIDRVAYARRWALENRALGRDGLFDQIERQIYPSTTGPNTLSTLLIGQNDNSDANTHPLTYRAALMGAALWLTTRHKSLGKDSVMSNGWRADSQFRDAIQTDTPGATASSRINGSVIYVVARSLLQGSAHFTVVIDGREFGPYATEPSFVTAHRSSFAPFAVRIAGLNPAPHRVAVVNQGGGTLHLDFMAGNANQLGSTGPFLVMATDYKAKTFWLRALIVLNTMVRTVEAQLAQDGLGVSLAEVQSACDDPAQPDGSTPGGSLCSLHDGVHPDDSGEVRIAAAFLKAMPALPLTSEKMWKKEVVIGAAGGI